jgi:hypothetical protein
MPFPDFRLALQLREAFEKGHLQQHKRTDSENDDDADENEQDFFSLFRVFSFPFVLLLYIPMVT